MKHQSPDRFSKFLARILRGLLWFVDPPPVHPLVELTKAGSVDPTVIFNLSHCYLVPGAIITIGRNSIFQGELRFLRAGAFHMGAKSLVGTHTCFYITQSISIGNDVLIASGCTFIDSDMHSQSFNQRKNDVLFIGQREGFPSVNEDWSIKKTEPIRINDRVWVGLNSMILKGVTLGEGCIVGAGSVVTSDVPPWVVVAGNPARVIRALEKED